MFVYAFSRGIYRELAAEIVEDQRGAGHTNHECVLRACEAAVDRLVTDRRHFARPARKLFCDMRTYFPLCAQARVLRVIEHYVGLTDEYLRRLPQNGLDANGNPLRCRASTRQGKPCRRAPLPHNGYCPSHQHLARTEDLELAAAA